ncbi:hypothetical protein ACUY3H_05225 [Corynebacterium ureicelerivorans]
MSALDAKQRELLLQIAKCTTADDTLVNLLSDAPSSTLPCAEICNYQIQQAVETGHSRDEYTKTMFHVPEPWNGNLETAEILFVSSNPSFDPNEEFPKLANDSWPDEKVVDFFVNRFNESNYGENNAFWKAVRKTAAYILGETDEFRKLSETDTSDRAIIRSIEYRTAITEAVHCKSQSEKVSPIEGQGDVKLKTSMPVFQKCFDTHTKPVINYFLQSPGSLDKPKTVVFMGSLTRDYVLKLGERRGMDKDQLTTQLQNFCMEEFGENSETARFLFIPHATSGRSWKSLHTKKSYPKLRDIDRQEIIDDQLDLWF